MSRQKNLLLLLTIIALTMTSITAKAQSVGQLGKLMAKQVNSIKCGNSATMTSSVTASDDDTQALISGIPRPKSKSQTSNITINREYYSDFIGPLGIGKIFIPMCNPDCTMADVKKFMSLPNVDENNESSMMMYTLYSNSTKNEDSELATYTYMFVNGQFFHAIIMFRQKIDRDRCLAWMVRHYNYENSIVEGGMDMHVFKCKDGKTHASVNFNSVNGSDTFASITYSKY